MTTPKGERLHKAIVPHVNLMKALFLFMVASFILASSCLSQRTAFETNGVISSFADREKSYRSSPEFLLRAFTASRRQMNNLLEAIEASKDHKESKTLMTRFNSFLERSRIYQAQLEPFLNSSGSDELLSQIRSATDSKLPAPFEHK